MKKALIIIGIVAIVIGVALVILNLGSGNDLSSSSLTDIFSSKPNMMKEQIENILIELKSKTQENNDRIYKLEDLKELGIEIPKTPYNTEYSKESYISYIGNEYYACFDDGENKVCGNYNELQNKKVEKKILGAFGTTECEFNITEEQAKDIAKKELYKRYNEEFEISDFYFERNTLELPGSVYTGNCILEMYPKELGKDMSFRVCITDELDVGEGYYNLLIKDEYEKIIRNVLDKYYNNYIINIKFNSLYYYEHKVNSKLNLEEALSKDIIQADIICITKNKIDENKNNKIANELSGLKGKSRIIIYQVQENSYNAINNEYSEVKFEEIIDSKSIWFNSN